MDRQRVADTRLLHTISTSLKGERAMNVNMETETPKLGKQYKAMGGSMRLNPSLLVDCNLVKSSDGSCSIFFSEVGAVDLGGMARWVEERSTSS